MSTQTPNIGLEKPAPAEFYDIAIFNANSDIIDNEITDAKAGSTARVFKVKSSTANEDAVNIATGDARYANKATNQTALDLKADKATTYTKTELDTSIGLKANQATTYTKTEVDSANNAQNSTIAGKETPTGAQAKVNTHAGVKSSSTAYGHAKMSVSGSTLTITTT